MGGVSCMGCVYVGERRVLLGCGLVCQVGELWEERLSGTSPTENTARHTRGDHVRPGWTRYDSVVPDVITVDDTATWSFDILRTVEHIANRVGPNPYTSDLEIDSDEEDTFRREQLNGFGVLAYHATRLFPHERDSILDLGLLPLNNALVTDRIESAATRELFSEHDAEELRSQNLIKRGVSENRENQVCLFLSRRTLDNSVTGIWNPLTHWGGEAVYFGFRRSPSDGARSHILSAGVPSIVVATLDLSPGWQTHPVWPGVVKSFVRRVLDNDDYDSSVHYHAVVPNVVAVWQPGQEEYDAHSELPRD
jgi:hypothetical protein